MDFDRKKVAYYFDQVNDVVQLTSSVGLLNQLDKAAQLKPLGMQVPTSQLLEKIIPDELAGFNFNNILPSFAGMDLASLLPDLKMPDGAGDHVKITHQFDDQTQSGWVQADVDLPFAGPSTVFSAGPVQVTIANIDFTATVRIEVGTNGSPKQMRMGNHGRLGPQPRRAAHRHVRRHALSPSTRRARRSSSFLRQGPAQRRPATDLRASRW